MIQVITHKKNRHRSNLWKPKRVKGLTFIVRFDEDAKYNHRDNDQKDWNKLFGIKRRYFRPKKDSIMGAWRYNPKNDLFEVCYYTHNKKGDVHTFGIVTLRPGQAFKFKIYDIWSGWLIYPWFGGNKRAPKVIKYIVELL